ncbi:hypothetical protein AcW1_004907 [Taiwanofungus camphoratus]|nr:hypothetical protein AcV7_002956 [Antrodia cinnamomea]KAI0960380.1 hypothetical protein AcW1_004907 [Antrodia cinnamomea]
MKPQVIPGRLPRTVTSFAILLHRYTLHSINSPSPLIITYTSRIMIYSLVLSLSVLANICSSASPYLSEWLKRCCVPTIYYVIFHTLSPCAEVMSLYAACIDVMRDEQLAL